MDRCAWKAGIREEVEVSAVKVAKDDGRATCRKLRSTWRANPARWKCGRFTRKAKARKSPWSIRIHVPFHVLLGGVNTVNGSVIVKGVEGGRRTEDRERKCGSIR